MKLSHIPICICICILGFFTETTNARFILLSNTSVTLFDEKCQNFKFIGPDMKGITINASYIAADPWDACSTLHNKEKYEGKIVLFGVAGCLPSQKAKHVQEAGGIVGALLLSDDYYESLVNAKYDYSSGIDIPTVVSMNYASTENFQAIVCSSYEPCDWLKNSAQGITDPDSNDAANIAVITADPREEHDSFWITFSVVISLFSLVNVVLGGFRLYELIVSQGKFAGTLPEICLIIEVAANIERIIMCIDPDYSTGWGIFPFTTNVVIQFLSIPWTLSATALIGAYWNRALGHFVQSTHESTSVFHPEKWKIPIAILCFFLVVWGTINAALQGYVVAGSWALLGESIYIIVCVGVTIYFMVTGVRILLAVRKTTAVTKSAQRLKKLGFLVGVSGLAIFLMIAGLAVIAADNNLWKVYAFFSFIGLNLMSFAKVVIFEATHKVKSTDTQSPETHTHKSTQLPELQTA